jgi:alpha-glucosidase
MAPSPSPDGAIHATPVPAIVGEDRMGLFAVTVLASALATATVPAVPAVAGERRVALAHGVEVRHGGMLMRVDAVTDAVLRVRIGRDGRLPEDASWAVDAATRAATGAVTATADGFTTAALAVHLDPATLALTVTDRAGKTIVADAAEPIELDGRGFTLRKAMPLAEHYFGLGDKTGGMDRRGGSFVDWNTDAFGFSSATDPIYKSIPFFLGVGGEGGSWGLFLDNTWRTSFDFGRREVDTLAIGSNDGPIDYYLIAGPTTAAVVRRYSDLTGRAPLPPRWTLGYQQSRYSYMSAAELRAVADRLRAEKIPTDVLWLDIGFLDRNTPFTVDRATFPDLPGLIREEGRNGFRIVTITDLHVAANRPAGTYPPFDTGKPIDAFVHRADGRVYVAPVWPGPSVFPDFTLPGVRSWWGGLFRDQVAMGVAGSWNDMNEPAVFDTPTKTMPLDNVHRIAGDGFAARTATHAEIHNVYGMENSRATMEGLKRFAPDERPFVMTRASYAGGQRYAATWTGDNSATWDHLKLSVQQIVNMGLSGWAWSAADVSGFAGGPSADLLTRWFEIGAFYPVFRDHSASGTPRVEPWVDGPEHLAIRRRFVEERYRLMPYLYALADQNARVGDPVMRPVFYDYPEALRLSCDQSWSFTLGKALMVAPPPHPESPQAYDLCLPAGGWFDYWTGKRVGAAANGDAGPIQSASQATGEAHGSSDQLRVTPSLASLPVFVRAGTILPRQAVVQSTAETPKGPLMLDVYPGDECAGTLYLDDGHSMAYMRGGFLRQEVRCRMTPTGLVLDFARREGRFRPWWRQIEVTVHGWSGDSRIGDGKVAATADAGAQTLAFTLPDQPRPTSITINRR